MNDPSPIKAPKSGRELLAGVKVIDVDTHISEPWDLWTSRAPKHLKNRVPRFVETDGVPHWVIDHDTFLAPLNGFSAVMRDGSKVFGYDFNKKSVAEVHEGASNVKARLKYMDDQGIYAQVAYPNLLGFGGQKAQQIDESLRVACMQIYNDAMAEWQTQSGGRIYPMALLPWWNVEQSVEEARRCAAMGLRGININSDPHQYGSLPPLGDAHWDPLWRTAIDLDLPVNFHIGASDASFSWFNSGSWPTPNDNKKLALGGLMLMASNFRVMGNILASKMLERFPTLKMVSVESGIGWIPFLLEALPYNLQQSNVTELTTPVAEVFRRQMYACTFFEREGFADNVRKVGVDNVMWETDFPHPACIYPDGLEYMAEALVELTPEERFKIFSGNAAKVYNIPISA
jgi:predicted TIM-barrel fold metal-dependent hydrolase